MIETQLINNNAFEKEPLTWKFWKKRRYIVVILAFFGYFNMFAMRVNLSIAIVAMTTNRTIYDETGTIIGYEQYFPWSTKEQGLILSSFFFGYILTQIFAGYVGARIGGHLLFGVGTLSTGIFTLFTPYAAKIGGIYLIVSIRIIEGLFEGTTYPSIHAIWSKWAPPLERTRMGTIAYSGIPFGTAIALPICGILSKVWGWESLFYAFGVITCLWYLVWLLIVRERPSKDKYITDDELNYIQNSLKQKSTDTNKNINYPWKSILTSKPVWAIVISNFCENWGYLTLLTHLPTYLKNIIGYDLDNVGYLSALPYLLMGCCLCTAGYLADLLQIKGWLNTSQVRRYFNCISLFGQSIFILLTAFLLKPVGIIICLTFVVGLAAFAHSAFGVNHLDLAPQYASVLMGIGGTVGSIPGIIGPILTGYIVETGSPNEWKIVFSIASGMFLFGAIVYWFWSSGELQPWAQPQQQQQQQQQPQQQQQQQMIANEDNENNKMEEDEREPTETNKIIEIEH